MRKTILFLFCLLLSQLTWAENVSREEAQQKALQFLNKQAAQPMPGKRMPIKNAPLTLAKDAKSYYVFNVGERQGFVVVSGDDRTPAILGYADDGQFDKNDVPENMQAWLQKYADQIAWMEQHPTRSAKAPVLDEHAAVKPLLRTKWNQGSPYNDQCPLDNGVRSVTGCVATAMAQVLFYHKHPAQTIAEIPDFYTSTQGIHVDAIGITTLDWNEMLYEYNGSETATEKNAVATLMQLCGSSVRMNYTSGASGASSSLVPTAFKDYFDYDEATTLASRSDYRARDWDNLIYNELANKRPVYYSGQSTGGGHAFVIDGYDKEGLFHVNWGWGGSCDGYFLLSILDPGSNSGIGASSSTDGYSYGQDAMINAQPNTGVTPIVEAKMVTYSVTTEQTSVTLDNGVFPINLTTSIYNSMNKEYTFDIGVGLFNANGELQYAEWIYSDQQLGSGWGWNSIGLYIDVPALPNGTYTITPISRETNTNTWYINKNGYDYYISATINGNVMTLQSPTIDLSGNMEVSGSKQAGSSLTTVTTIQNNGSFFKKELFLRVNGDDVGGRYFEVEAGSSETIEMTFTPYQTGTYNLSVGYYTYYYNEQEEWTQEYHELASKSVEVTAAKSYSLSFSNGIVTNAVDGVINESTAKLQLTVTNNSEYAYDDDLKTWAWARTGDSWYYATSTITSVHIEAGETKTVDIDVEGLESGSYWFIVVYKSEGDFTEYNDYDNCYRDFYDYTVAIQYPTYTANFINGAQWENVYAYTFDPKMNGAWPGQQIAKTGTTTIDNVVYDVYTYTVEAETAPGYIIFNNGNGGEGNQTADLVFEDGGTYSYGVIRPDVLNMARELAADDDAVAVGKLRDAIDHAVESGDDSGLQAAIEQFKADNADQEKDETAKVATDGWKKFTGNAAAGVCATQFAPAITTYDGRTANLAENYEETVNTTGQIIYQDITGLTNGKYKVGFYGNAFYTSGRGFASDMEEGAEDVAYVFANEQQAFITAHIATSTTTNDFRQFDVEVTNGEIKLGMGKAKAGTNWHTMQIYQLTWFTTAKEVYAEDKAKMEALIDLALELSENPYKPYGHAELNGAIDAANTALNSNKLNISEFEAEIAKMEAAIQIFKEANYIVLNGTYYVQAQNGKYMAAGHDYGTRGIVNESGLDLIVTADENKVYFDSQVSNGGNNEFLGSNLYMDSTPYAWCLERTGEDSYAIGNGTQYIGVDDDDNLIMTDEPTEWMFITAESLTAERMESLNAATAENGVDATFLIKGANFNRNDRRNYAWNISDDCTNWNISGGNETNNCAESYHSTFTISQTIQGAPAGIYKMTAQGFYRQGSDEEAVPQFFANGIYADVPLGNENESSMNTASNSFTAGLYTIEPIEFKCYSNGEIVIGVKGEGTNQWVIFDNFQLTYYGPAETETYTVAGAFNTTEGGAEDVIFGTSWDPTLEANDMVKGDNGLYTKTYEKVDLGIGTIYYKVVADHSWYAPNWGFNGNNADYGVNEAGVYDITFTFSPNGLLANGYNVACYLERNEIVTGIREAGNTQDSHTIYNLNGQQVTKAKKGLYIVDGKKVVKD